MFKKRKKTRGKKTTRKASSIATEPSSSSSSSSSVSSSDFQQSILAATRAEQAERTKRRTASVVVVSGDGQASVKRRRVGTNILLTKQHEAANSNKLGDDQHLKDFISQRMGKTESTTNEEASTTTTTTTTSEGQVTTAPEKEMDPYDLLRRQSSKHLTAEQGGVSEIAGSGVAGIGIYEVDLPDHVKKKSAAATDLAIAKAKSQKSQRSALSGLKLPSSFSGNFVASGHLLRRGDVVTMPDGSHLQPKNPQLTRATDFKAMKQFKVRGF
jgi:hypothetical protein